MFFLAVNAIAFEGYQGILTSKGPVFTSCNNTDDPFKDCSIVLFDLSSKSKSILISSTNGDRWLPEGMINSGEILVSKHFKKLNSFDYLISLYTFNLNTKALVEVSTFPEPSGNGFPYFSVDPNSGQIAFTVHKDLVNMSVILLEMKTGKITNTFASVGAAYSPSYIKKYNGFIVREGKNGNLALLKDNKLTLLTQSFENKGRGIGLFHAISHDESKISLIENKMVNGWPKGCEIFVFGTEKFDLLVKRDWFDCQNIAQSTMFSPDDSKIAATYDRGIQIVNSKDLSAIAEISDSGSYLGPLIWIDDNRLFVEILKNDWSDRNIGIYHLDTKKLEILK